MRQLSIKILTSLRAGFFLKNRFNIEIICYSVFRRLKFVHILFLFLSFVVIAQNKKQYGLTLIIKTKMLTQTPIQVAFLFQLKILVVELLILITKKNHISLGLCNPCLIIAQQGLVCTRSFLMPRKIFRQQKGRFTLQPRLISICSKKMQLEQSLRTWIPCNLLVTTMIHPFSQARILGSCRFAIGFWFPGASRHRPQYPTDVWRLD